VTISPFSYTADLTHVATCNLTVNAKIKCADGRVYEAAPRTVTLINKPDDDARAAGKRAQESAQLAQEEAQYAQEANEQAQEASQAVNTAQPDQTPDASDTSAVADGTTDTVLGAAKRAETAAEAAEAADQRARNAANTASSAAETAQVAAQDNTRQAANNAARRAQEAANNAHESAQAAATWADAAQKTAKKLQRAIDAAASTAAKDAAALARIKNQVNEPPPILAGKFASRRANRVSTVPRGQWAGEQVVFVNDTESDPASSECVRWWDEGAKFDNGNYVSENDDLEVPVGKIAGHVGTVLASSSSEITVRIDDLGITVKTEPDQYAFGLVLLSDLEGIRNYYVGRRLWRKEADETGRKYQPVRVIDVKVSSNWALPFSFVMRSGAGRVSTVDAAQDRKDPDSVIEADFLLKDPRSVYDWGSRAWTAIEYGKVFIGMTAAQAKMSWGEPSDVNRTIVQGLVNEQWVYGDEDYLYFDNGILTGIQN
jgi:hypothetical protein